MSNVIKVNVDLNKEIAKMAQKDGIQNPAELEVPMEMKRRDFYADIIAAYYAGKDDGYAAGAANGTFSFKKFWIAVIAVATIGNALGLLMVRYVVH